LEAVTGHAVNTVDPLLTIGNNSAQSIQLIRGQKIASCISLGNNLCICVKHRLNLLVFVAEFEMVFGMTFLEDLQPRLVNQPYGRDLKELR
jgi:hypothetical protein